MKKAVLFLTFNRLDTTRRVFEEIKKARPPRLYLASDGARENKDGEKETVQKIRSFILNNIDWECEIKTLFRDKNLGCGKAVSGAITWFFSQEEDGIILEDDCLPHQSFFKYCEELLEYYKKDKRVWHISGNQFVPNFDNGASYYFAKIQHVWGWASWADRWQEYEFDLSIYDKENIRKFSENKRVVDYWLDVFDKVKRGTINTWDYQWTFKIIEKDGLCINPSKNLVSNIGFREDGTHTSDKYNPLANLPIFEISEIIHPKNVIYDNRAVEYIYNKIFGIKTVDIKKNIFKKLYKYVKYK